MPPSFFILSDSVSAQSENAIGNIKQLLPLKTKRQVNAPRYLLEITDVLPEARSQVHKVLCLHMLDINVP